MILLRNLGFTIIIEPSEDKVVAGSYNPILHLSCLDASIAIKPVFGKISVLLVLMSVCNAFKEFFFL